MPLTLITGPAGSGKTGEILERFAAMLEREPVLVVPAYSDVERFEDELLARRPVALGGRVTTFAGLVEMAAAGAGHVPEPPLAVAQRRMLLRAVATGTQLGDLAVAARRPRFVDALDAFVSEVQAASIDPATLGRRLSSAKSHAPGHLRDAARLCAAYAERRDALGRSDAGAVLTTTAEALRSEPASWGGRPILFHGFDDLSPAQLELVAALAAGADVTVSVVHEPGRACLAARRRLVERLEQLGPSDRVELAHQTRPGLLAHLERSFLQDDPPRRAPDESLRLLDAAGPRNEVEQAAGAIARLLLEGTGPDEIAVILRAPAAMAGLLDEVFAEYGIPTALHVWRRFDETATGAAAIALLRAALITRSATDLIAFLRCPGRSSPWRVDRLEREARRRGIDSADEAIDRWRDAGGRELWEVDELRAAADRGPLRLLDRMAGIIRSLAEVPHRRSAPMLAEEAAEQRVADAAANAVAEVAELAASDATLAPDPQGLVELLAATESPRSARSTRGRVEIMSPYRARARQFSHVFLLSLQDGDFPRRGREDPFLSDAERSTAGLAERADTREEERYLFYVAITRATRRLHLSFRTTDEEGQAHSRSFLVDEVLDLLEPGSEAELTDRKGLWDTVFARQAVPTERELARALAADRLTPQPAAEVRTERNGDGRHSFPDDPDVLAARLERARDRADRLPGALRVPFVVEQFAARDLIGASSLESYAECPFRYFVDHELHPRELAPDAEPLTRGSLVHRVLEQLYEERREQGEPTRATPATLDALIARARELLSDAARDSSLAPRRPATRAIYRRMESDLVRLLRYDAEHGAGAEVHALEAAFGDAGEPHGPLELDGFKLHGKIDRIDLAPTGEAIVRDYKTGAKVTARKKLSEQGKLQLPLYLLAARRLWGLDVAGAVYHPLGNQRDVRPRGLLRGPADAVPFGEPFVGSDITDDDAEFERHLSEARADAERIAGQIHAGHLARTPLGGSCPHYCDFHPICRRERGEKNPEEAERLEWELADE